MDLPVSITAAPFPSGSTAGRELAPIVQDRGVAATGPAEFRRTLDNTLSGTDTIEVSTVLPAVTVDPTASSLFQSHAGALRAVSVPGAPADGAMVSPENAQLRVEGVGGTGAFDSGQSLPPDYARLELQEAGSAQATRYPPAAGAGDFSATYDALRGVAAMNPRLGIALDLKG